MNSRFFKYLTLIVLSIFLAVGLVFGAIVYSFSRSSVEKMTIEIHKTYMEEVISNFRNGILSGNFRFFRAQISSLVERGAFAEYALVQSDQIVDATPGYESTKSDSSFYEIRIPIWFNEQNNALWGYVSLLVDRDQKKPVEGLITNFIYLLLFLGVLLAAIALATSIAFWRKMNVELGGEISALYQGNASQASRTVLELWQPTLNILKEQKLAHEVLQTRSRELERQAMHANISSQIAHDIRSPLSALNMVLGATKELSEEKRVLIRSAVQRINDIANGLLQKSKGKRSEASQADSDGEPVMLVALLDMIISEKRQQFSQSFGLEIHGDLAEGYGLFSKINPTELARVTSNLVNNSVEAMENGGKVFIRVQANDDKATLTVEDDGKGIPEVILGKLGERGASFGKHGSGSGSGLGLNHAIEVVRSAGGEFKIQSQVGKGTKITIELPSCPAPSWFTDRVVLRPKQVVVSVDDDATIHKVWAEKLSSSLRDAGVEHRSFTSTEKLKEWFVAEAPADCLFLVDFEFEGQRKNGLDVIEALGIQNRSILVTSRYDEPRVRSRAQQMRVRLLPKSLAPLVPTVTA